MSAPGYNGQFSCQQRRLAMQSTDEIARSGHVIPWNKGKLVGPKPPLQTKHVWAIRSKLQMEGRTRELAMFNLAIDSKLRGCDLLSAIGSSRAIRPQEQRRPSLTSCGSPGVIAQKERASV
jgi:hypothetical protein